MIISAVKSSISTNEFKKKHFWVPTYLAMHSENGHVNDVFTK